MFNLLVLFVLWSMVCANGTKILLTICYMNVFATVPQLNSCLLWKMKGLNNGMNLQPTPPRGECKDTSIVCSANHK